MKIAYVTTAQQGAGHFTRGVAIGRGLVRAGYDGGFRIFSPPIPYPIQTEFQVESFELLAGEALDPARAAHSQLAESLRRFDPDLVLVDLYWYAVQNVLAHLACEAWLLVRCCPKNWFDPRRLLVDGTEIVTAFDRSRFSRIIAIEALWFDFFTDLCAPIVVCNPEDCRPPSALRRRLEVPLGQRLVAVTHGGLAGEIDRLHIDRLPGDVVARLSLYDPDPLYPAAEWMTGADIIYSGAGYNSYWEARWLGHADRTRFTAFKRQFDWQAWRLEHSDAFPMKRNGADVLASWVLGTDVQYNLLTRLVRRWRRFRSAPRPKSPGGPSAAV